MTHPEMKDQPTGLTPVGSTALSRAMTRMVQRCATKGLLPPVLNNGLCYFVAREVQESLAGHVTTRRNEFTGVEYYTFGSNAEAYHGLFDARYPGWKMPYGLTLQELCATTYFDVAHVWLSSNGLHYDAQCVEGVRNFLDLPIFRSNMVSAVSECYPEKWSHLMQHPWWQYSLMLSEEVMRTVNQYCDRGWETFRK